MYAELDRPWDWARVGAIWFGDGLDVLIRVDDPAEEPCFHVIDSRAGKFDIAISLAEPRYLRLWEARLTDEAQRALDKFFRGRPKCSCEPTAYDLAVSFWNTCNPNRAMAVFADESGNTIIPDYANIISRNPYKERYL